MLNRIRFSFRFGFYIFCYHLKPEHKTRERRQKNGLTYFTTLRKPWLDSHWTGHWTETERERMDPNKEVVVGCALYMLVYDIFHFSIHQAIVLCSDAWIGFLLAVRTVSAAAADILLGGCSILPWLIIAAGLAVHFSLLLLSIRCIILWLLKLYVATNLSEKTREVNNGSLV